MSSRGEIGISIDYNMKVIEEVVKRGYNSEKLAETYSALVKKENK